MSKAQKLVNRARAILQNRGAPNGLNDLQALTELETLIERTQDDGVGTASDMVSRAKKTMREHASFALSDEQALDELISIFGEAKGAAIADKNVR